MVALLLLIIYVISVLCLSRFCVCSLLPCGHLMTSWLLFVVLNCVLVTFLVVSRVLNVSIPDIGPLSYFKGKFNDCLFVGVSRFTQMLVICVNMYALYKNRHFIICLIS